MKFLKLIAALITLANTLPLTSDDEYLDSLADFDSSFDVEKELGEFENEPDLLSDFDEEVVQEFTSKPRSVAFQEALL